MKFSVAAFLKKYLFSFFKALFLTFILQGILSITFSFIHPPAKVVSVICSLMAYLTVFIATFFYSLKIEKHGVLTGLVCSVTYTLLLLLAGVLMLNNSYTFSQLFKVLTISALCGGIGGILGINLKK